MWKLESVETGTLMVTEVQTINRAGVFHDPGKVLRIPQLSWILTNATNGKTLLVDAGLPVLSESEKEYRSILQNSKQIKAIERLQTIEFSAVIQTHLHWNAGAGLPFLKGNPTIFVQQNEFRHACNPHTIEKPYYGYKEKSDEVFFAKLFHSFQFLNRDTEICEGVQAMFLPGHTPGFMGLKVAGENNSFLLAGDLAPRNENVVHITPPGIRNDTFASYNSLLRIIEDGSTIIFGHEKMD